MISQQKNEGEKLTLYHASRQIVRIPIWDYEKAEVKSDFGLGFYTSPDTEQPLKLLCNEAPVILNTYEVDFTGLKVKEFKADQEWLLLVAFNRREFKKKKALHEIKQMYRQLIEDIDVVIGPIADDRMFSVINDFISNAITDECAIACMNMMGYDNQYVFKSKAACDKLKFKEEDLRILSEEEIQDVQQHFARERDTIDDTVDSFKISHRNKGKLFAEILNEKVKLC
ncbi:MAG: DUF3990 domain-containing protein [Cellulosilyticaceae bacterium]